MTIPDHRSTVSCRVVLCRAVPCFVCQVDLVAVDSVAALLPRAELEGVIGDQQVSLRGGQAMCCMCAQRCLMHAARQTPARSCIFYVELTVEGAAANRAVAVVGAEES